MAAKKLRDMLVTILIGAFGGLAAKLRKAVGGSRGFAFDVLAFQRVLPRSSALDPRFVDAAVKIARERHRDVDRR